ncbi:MAG: SDR family NAD(P)-dependent oxidoreductase [Polaromonas sp.]|uniref:SDR family NAD(P)-dependent oxidoreductase n=1 Tax=Polaromonas sp. TaxID=1869339 RepID=UPI002733A50B|nr:SDR family NAD(P)-dependent oxidoreductase [Polaromonas sp.]MDP2817370.1 SDR family NAD(P)-dependent oxidoreductase [Polaromonas sp.]
MAYNPPLRDWHGKTVWLVGASSGIGQATAHALHARGARVVVSARNAGALDDFVRSHAGAVALPLDAADPAAVAVAAQAVLAQGPIDLMMYCAGHYREMRAAEFDLAEMLKHQQVNYTGALYLLDALLPAMRQRGTGHISLVGSVAGYRGLPKSLAYGPTKAALINLAETLYLDLQASGVGVSLVSPGFVETPLTAQNRFSMPALISPAKAADEILRGWADGEFEIHFPKRFTLWMKTLRVLPYALYFPAIRKFTGL